MKYSELIQFQPIGAEPILENIELFGAVTSENSWKPSPVAKVRLNWDFDRATLAYRREVRWSDGRTTRQGFLERPQLLIENGIPTHLFCATAEGPGLDLKDATRTWNVVFPLGK
jgi:hypothetical protein